VNKPQSSDNILIRFLSSFKGLVRLFESAVLVCANKALDTRPGRERRIRKAFGVGMRHADFLLAPALRTGTQILFLRLNDDHQRARTLANVLSQYRG